MLVYSTTRYMVNKLSVQGGCFELPKPNEIDAGQVCPKSPFSLCMHVVTLSAVIHQSWTGRLFLKVVLLKS